MDDDGHAASGRQPEVLTAHPDVILLHVGTNDLLSGTSAVATAQRLDTMLTIIHTVSSASVVVAEVWAPLPTRVRRPVRSSRDSRPPSCTTTSPAAGR